MYNDEHIHCLNQFGILSRSFLMRKFNLTEQRAMIILKKIVEDYDEAWWVNNWMIALGDKPEMQECTFSPKIYNCGRKPKYKRVRRI